MRSGIVGTSVTALVRDVRRVLEPNTASHLRVSIMDFYVLNRDFDTKHRNVDQIVSRILSWWQVNWV